MRPIRLEIKGFTAFRDPQTVDFEGLDLFAISGPTGSGKSSILDAITYALFGYVERVGKQVAQFVSQGQVRMAVCFEFAVDGDRFRVTRSTPAKGPSKILLERREGDEWRQAGEGADRLRDADAMIRRAVGLDYDAFTRTVLLPQGRFAEFLVGDAKERRAILTDLLGLELFVRLGSRAGELRRDADSQAKAKAALLETEYAGVTPDAVADAEARAKEAAGRDAALAEAEVKVRGVADRWADAARTIRELEACALDLREASAAAAHAAGALDELAGRAVESDALAKELARSSAATAKLAEKATAARSKAEDAWGRAVDLARLRARAEALLVARAENEEAVAELEAARAHVPRLEEAAEAARERLDLAAADAEAAVEALAGAEEALEDARHADLVAAVASGVRRGDDCPVCGAKVSTLPKRTGAPSLQKAEAALAAARTQGTAAHSSVQEAERAWNAATAETASAGRDVGRCEQALAKATSVAKALEEEVSAAIGPKLAREPVQAVDERIARLLELEEQERTAAEASSAAREAVAASERERDRLAAGVAESRARLDSIVVGGLLDRARAVAGPAAPIPELPGLGDGDASSLAAMGADRARALGDLAQRLEEVATDRGSGEREVVREAAGHVGDLIGDVPGTLAELLELVGSERTAAARAAAMTEDGAERLRAKLVNSASIVEQIAGHRARADVFDALTRELRADRLIAFLQVEALQLLAAAGSERLSTLSSGRYRLEFDEDEFFVVDTWNGEERRSARTLSGGETFLASLALALALSEQVRSLAVTEKARLDSLFLDEGFGTLDPETLETVVEAIEQLGGDGRMVGLITHVQELAIRLPARVEVQKSPRGSTLRVVV